MTNLERLTVQLLSDNGTFMRIYLGLQLPKGYEYGKREHGFPENAYRITRAKGAFPQTTGHFIDQSAGCS